MHIGDNLKMLEGMICINSHHLFINALNLVICSPHLPTINHILVEYQNACLFLDSLFGQTVPAKTAPFDQTVFGS